MTDEKVDSIIITIEEYESLKNEIEELKARECEMKRLLRSEGYYFNGEEWDK